MTSRDAMRVACLAAALPVLQAAAQNPPEPLSIARQGSFFVGGREVRSEGLSVLPEYANGTATVDQMYVRYQVPAAARGMPITLVHGCCLTGKTWETTPDGRMGWDEYFLRKGHAVYVVDQVSRGRSGMDAAIFNTVRQGKAPPDALPRMFFAGHEAAWSIFRFGPEYGKSFPGMRFPVEAAGELWKQMVPDWNSSLPEPTPTIRALSDLAIRVGGTVLLGHSQSGIYPMLAAALNPKGIAAIVSIEPGGCPDANADAAPYAGLPILVLWGDFVPESPRWGPRLKGCLAFAAAVNRKGGKVENLELPKVGIRGNSHMLMQDTNNLEVADVVLAWIERSVGARKK